MSRTMMHRVPGTFFAMLLVLFIACSESTTEPTPVEVTQILLTPNAHSMTVGDAVTLNARAVDADGETINGIAFEWSSSDQTVATVSNDGVVTAAGAGQATIRARSTGKEGSARITVALAPVASITITPPTATLGVGLTADLVATLRDAAGRELTGRLITWASTEPSVASVDAAGKLTALAEGQANVSATSEGKQATIAVKDKFDIFSKGPDRQPNTEDDLGNW